MVPLMLFIWALESKKTRINRYRNYGWSWKTVDGTAYLRSLMHADGNIKYANYQSEAQMTDYLTTLGHDSVVAEIV